MRLGQGLLLAVVLQHASIAAEENSRDMSGESPRSKASVENWDKGGALSHWVYTHVPDLFRTAVIKRGGPIVDLPVELKPEIGALKLNKPGEPEQTLDQFVNNGAVDACIVLHNGKIVYEKYPTIRPNDVHIVMSVTKAFVLTVLAILEDQGKIDIERPVENYLPELKGSDWAGTKCVISSICAPEWKASKTVTMPIAVRSTRSISSKPRSGGNHARRQSCRKRRGMAIFSEC